MNGVVAVCAAAAVLALIVSVIKRTEAGVGGVLSVLISVWLLYFIIQGIIYLKNGIALSEKYVSGYLPFILKSAGIGFISQTTADICRDSGEASAGNKIATAGKLGILTVCLPLIKQLLDTAIGYINQG